MPTYVDGFVIPGSRPASCADYRRLAQRMGKLWIEHGALAGARMRRRRRQARQAHVVSAGGEAEGRRDRGVLLDRVQVAPASRPGQCREVMKDPRIARHDMGPMPFDTKRMFFGGFKEIVGAVSASGFIWYELLADDAPRRRASTRRCSAGGARQRPAGPGYQFFSTGECDIGGLMTLAAGAKAMGAKAAVAAVRQRAGRRRQRWRRSPRRAASCRCRPRTSRAPGVSRWSPTRRARRST